MGQLAMWRVLFLLGGLRPLGGLEKEPSYEKLHVQITVPEKIHSISRGEFESHVSYTITIQGELYTVNLTQKIFLPHNFILYGYDGTGIMKPLEQPFKNFCYYQGYIEGYPNSMAIISTCTGLRGLLQFENVTYGIEPLESSTGFEHIIYQVKYKDRRVSLYAEKDIEFKNLSYRIQSIEPYEVPQYVELHVVVEKHLYNYMGSDPAVVTKKIFQLIGLTNAIFTPLKLTVILSSLELWVDENKMSTTGDANELLHRFLQWKRSYLVLRPHDVAFLFVYRDTSNYVGATFQGKMCDRDYGGGVAMHPKTVSLEPLAIILAQLLSLSMGIAYDDMSKCHCPGSICLMNPEAIHSSGVKIFSNCSVQDYAHFTSKQKSQCLQNQPHLEPSYKQEAAVCGNRMVEQGEECDCGTEEECGAVVPVCCNFNTCTLKTGSACAEGPCCEKCQYRPKGYTCRSPLDECDLSEYCNGSSASCPENFFVINGHPCGEHQWVCIEGKCQNGLHQCGRTFGPDTEYGSEECFNELNSKTDISGNCGSSASGYKACAPKDRKCGKLICKYRSDNLIKVKDATTIYANISGHICVALEFPFDHVNSPMMWVKDGTVCAPKKVCWKKECVDDEFLNYDCTPDNCNNQGVCNNKKHCHCNVHYLPPDCRTRLDGSPGGSIDSGNHGRVIARHFIERAYYQPGPARWPLFLLIPFFIILLVLIAILVKVHFQRKKWKSEDYTSDEQYESETESKE